MMRGDNVPSRAYYAVNKTSVTFILLIILTIYLAISGCNKSTNEPEYTLFTINEKTWSFSFDYPSSFDEPRTHRQKDAGDILISSAINVIPGNGFEMMQLYITAVSTKQPDYSTMLARDIEYSRHNLIDFELHGISPIHVLGFEGKMAEYSHTMTEIHGEYSALIFARVAYFEQNGNIWKIEVFGDESKIQESEAHFKHILETIKVFAERP